MRARLVQGRAGLGAVGSYRLGLGGVSRLRV